MFKIEDGREYFYQWDLDRRLIIEDNSITQVHFCNRTDDCSLVCEVYTEDNKRIANVPNILLQDTWIINVYGYDSNYTKHSEQFKVKKRSKPADYIYTETEVFNYEQIKEQLNTIIEQGVTEQQLTTGINNYFEKNPLTAEDVGALPDTTEIPSIEGLATEDYVDEAIANNKAVFTAIFNRESGSTLNTTTETTHAEIYEAYKSGKIIKANWDMMEFELTMIDEHFAVFEKTLIGTTIGSFVITLDDLGYVEVVLTTNVIGDSSKLTTTSKSIVGAINELNAKHTDGTYTQEIVNEVLNALPTWTGGSY